MSEPATSTEAMWFTVIILIILGAIGVILAMDNAKTRRCVAESRCGEVSEACK